MVFIIPRSHRVRWVLAGIGFLALVSLAPSMAAQSGRVVIVQTNSAGDSVSLIDPATDKIVGEIPDAEVIHGVAAAPDGSRLYLSNESTDTLDVVDAKTLKITKKIPLTAGGRTTSRSARTASALYVAIQRREGGVDVIDTVTQRTVKFIRILRGVHNTFITPDSKFVVAGSTGGIGRDGDRHGDRAAGLVDSLRRRRAPDLLRGQPRRLDEADVRADDQPARLRDRRLGRSARKSAASSCRTCRRPSATTRASRARRRTAS